MSELLGFQLILQAALLKRTRGKGDVTATESKKPGSFHFLQLVTFGSVPEWDTLLKSCLPQPFR